MSNWLHQWLCTNLPDDELQKLRADVYDRWTWDSAANIDRDLFEALDAEAESRKLASHNTLTFQGMMGGQGIVMVDDSATGTITITIDDEYIDKKVDERLRLLKEEDE